MSMWGYDVHSVFAMLRPRPNQLITDNSVLIRHGSLTFYSHNTSTNKPRYFFLFDHAFLVTKQRKRNKFQLKIYITLRPGLKLISDERDNQFRLNATLKGKSYPIIMWAYSRKEKDAWVKDLSTTIARLSDRNYGLEANPLSAQNREAEDKVVDAPSPRDISRRLSVQDSPQSYLRERDEESSPRLSYRPSSPRSDSSDDNDYRDPRSRKAKDDSSSPGSNRARNDSPSNRRRSVSAKSSNGGGSRRVAVETRTEKKEFAREQDLPVNNRPKRTRRVWYDEDEEPHYYTDSDNDQESEDDASGDDSGSSGSASSFDSEKNIYDKKKQNRESMGRRASEADVSRGGSKRGSVRRQGPVSDSVLVQHEGGGLAPPPKAASSKASKKRTSASLGNLPALDSPSAQHIKKEEKRKNDIADAFDLLSLQVPPVVTSPPPQQQHQHHGQHHQHQQQQHGQQPQHSVPHGASLGVKVMDVGGLNSQDFDKFATRGFSAGAQHPTTTQHSTTQQHSATTTAPHHSHQQHSHHQHQAAPTTTTTQTPSLFSLPTSTPTTPTPTTTPQLDPSMYQQMLLQQQQQYLQLLQQQQLQQQQQQRGGTTGQPLQAGSGLLGGQPSQTSLLGGGAGQASSLFTATSTPSSLGGLGQLQQQQLLQQQQQQQLLQQQQQQQQLLQHQLQLQQAQQLALLQRQQGGGVPTPTATPLAYSGLPQQQQQAGVIYVDPLTYFQYQQQQQLLQMQQQYQLQKQGGAGAGASYPSITSNINK